VVKPYFFWGFFPKPNIVLKGSKRKESYPPSVDRPALRSKIPLAVSKAFLFAIENQAVLL
jgi:hypothetical protein